MPSAAEMRTATTIEPIAHRRMWIGESWHDAAPVYSMSDALPGIAISGRSAITSPFTTGDSRPRRGFHCHGHRRHPDRAPSDGEGIAR